MAQGYDGRLELTWTNKHLALLAAEDGSYQWVQPSDYRVAEVRLLHDLDTVGEVHPKRERAKNNLLIHGDALNALTSLIGLPEFAREYVGKVKLAYLDPPFNTQQSFLHYDDALEHSVWLTMMRDRLIQIRTLLSHDGSVWIHCDDSEQHRLRVAMDEIFGASHFVGTVVWRSSDNSNNDAKHFSTDHNYLVVYSKTEGWQSERVDPQGPQTSHYHNPDNDPNGPWFDGNPLNSPNPRANLRYTIISPTGATIESPPNGWRWSRATLDKKIATGEIRFTADGKAIRRRTYLRDHKGLPASSLWVNLEETGHNRRAKSELKRLFPGIPTSDLFATPKPEQLISRILSVGSVPGDIVLDCFGGSGTTAAVAQKMRRRWVLVESDASTLSTFVRPRLEAVIAGKDPAGVTDGNNWVGGGGLRFLVVAPSMFEEIAGTVVLADWATNGQLSEATAAQLGFDFEPISPFAGRKGRKRLAVVDGVVTVDVVRLLASALSPDERLTVCGMAFDPEARAILKERAPGSTLRKIPASILDEYLLGRIESEEREASDPPPVESLASSSRVSEALPASTT